MRRKRLQIYFFSASLSGRVLRSPVGTDGLEMIWVEFAAPEMWWLALALIASVCQEGDKFMEEKCSHFLRNLYQFFIMLP